MHRFYVVEPEVAGGVGPHSVMDGSVHPPVVSRLHYVFDGWLGDEIVESFPCFLVTEALSIRLAQAGLTGFEIDAVEVTASDQFLDAHPGQQLPPFVWLKVDGIAGGDDFGIGPDLRLVVSSKALQAIQYTTPSALQVEPFT